MKVKCIDVGGNSFITVGKCYEVIDEWDESYLIVNDIGDKQTYYKFRFEVVPVKPSTEIQVGDIVKVLKDGNPSKGYVARYMDMFVGQELEVKAFNCDGRPVLSGGWIFEKETLKIVKRKENEMYTKDTSALQMVKNRQWIVGSINANGEFSMALHPAAHTSESAAKTEATRLAEKDSTKTFIVMQLRAGYKVSTVQEI